MESQPVLGYFMPRDLGILFFVGLYLHFYLVVSLEFFVANGPIEYR